MVFSDNEIADHVFMAAGRVMERKPTKLLVLYPATALAERSVSEQLPILAVRHTPLDLESMLPQCMLSEFLQLPSFRNSNSLIGVQERS